MILEAQDNAAAALDSLSGQADKMAASIEAAAAAADAAGVQIDAAMASIGAAGQTSFAELDASFAALDASASSSAAAFTAADAEMATSAELTKTKVITANEEMAVSSEENIAARAGGAFASMGSKIPIIGPLLGEMGEKMERAAGSSNALVAGLGAAGPGLIIAGVAIASVGAEAIHMGLEFQSATAKIAANADISTEAAKKIGEAMLDTMGKSTFSGKAMAEAYATVAGKLGELAGHALDAKEALAFTTQATDLAEASGVSLGSAMTDLSKIMNDLHQPLTAAAQDTDVLFNTARLTGKSVDDVAAAVDKLAPKMLNTGVTVQTMGGLMLDLTDKLGSSSRALATVGSAFQTLTEPSSAAQKVLDKLGVSLKDANGQFIGIGPALDALKSKIDAISDPAQKAAVMSQLFGKNANIMGQLVEEGSAGLAKYADKVGQADAAHQAAEKNSKTFEGTMKTLEATFSDVGTKLGILLLPVITKLGQVLATVLNFVMSHLSVFEKLGAVMFSLVTIGIAVGAILEKLYNWFSKLQIVKDVVQWIEDAGSAIGDAASSFANFISKINFSDVMHSIGAFFSSLPGIAERALSSLGGTLVDLGAKALNGLWSGIKAGWNAGLSFLGTIAGKILDALMSLPGLLVDLGAKMIHGLLDAIELNFRLVLTYFIGIPALIGVLFVDAIKWLAQAGTDLITGLWNAAKDVFTTVLAWLGTFITGIPDAIGDTIGWLKSRGEDLLNGLWNAAKDVFKDVISWLKTFITAIPDAVGDTIDWLKKHGEDLINGFWTAEKAGFDKVIAWLKTFISAIPDAVGDTIDWLKNKGEDLITGLWNAAKTAFKDVLKWASDLPQNIFDAIGDIAGKMFEIGKAIVQGIIDGISSIGGSITSEIMSLIPHSIMGIHLPWGAEGGIINGATMLIAGEAGPEALIPMDKFGLNQNQDGNITPLPSSWSNTSAPAMPSSGGGGGMDSNILRQILGVLSLSNDHLSGIRDSTGRFTESSMMQTVGLLQAHDRAFLATFLAAG